MPNLKLLAAATFGLGSLVLSFANRPAASPANPKSAEPGALTVIDRDGRPGAVCPLKHTAVDVEITGFLSRVRVTQQFENPLPEPIEAVYTFPLSQRAAVDGMNMLIGDRHVRGVIKRREEAQAIFEAARSSGKTASLLDQERPNIFTQSVTNIPPGGKVKIEIAYVETLNYEAGAYEFSFPMVVGPRYIPAHTDGSRIKPPVATEGTRAGHDLSLNVKLDAGVDIQSLASQSHEVSIGRPNAHSATIALKQRAVLPNKDFVLNYHVAGGRIEDALLTHRTTQRGGFFTLLLQPPDRPAQSQITPKEIVFVIDTSGSMSGFPIEKAKEVIKLALDNLHPNDTFNLITFAGDTHILFPSPVAATEANLRQAQQFLLSRKGGGGTEMMKAIRAALDPSDVQDHIRIVCFLTDGYVGNDMEIIGEVQRHPNARVFSFGIGSSVNRFLLDNMAKEGRGEVEYVSLNGDGSAAARRFHERVRKPLLTDISIDWNSLPVTDIYPARLPDLFSARPLAVTGRYSTPGSGTILLRGKVGGRAFSRSIPVRLAADEPGHDVLAQLWARTRIDDLMSQDWKGLQSGNPRTEVREAVTKLGLDFRLMTQFTSFVAVEERTVVEGGTPRRIEVPVEMPYGVSYEGVFGRETQVAQAAHKSAAFGQVAGARQPVAPMVINEAAGAQLTDRKSDDFRSTEKDMLASKIDPELLKRAASHTTAIRVKVWVSAAPEGVIAALKKAGLQILTTQPGVRFVIGSIAPAQLQALAKLDFVLYLSEDKPLP
jgi:Ca-activated chloride channel family protein